MLRFIIMALGFAALTGSALAASNIKKGMTEFSVTLNGETCKIAREQTKGNKINAAYATTDRGIPQPISLGNGIETLGEIEFIDYMMKAENDQSIIIVDTRTEGWHRDLRIPCTPVGLGITGPGMTRLQAEARIENAKTAVESVVKMHQRLK